MAMRIKNFVNRFGLAFLVLVAAFFWTAGCITHPDPLAGWHSSSLNSLHSNKAITDDSQDYIQSLKLSPEKRSYVAYIEFFEDGTGQHAEKITISLNKTDWENVLIYDKDDKRVKTIKYVSGHSAS
jgi:hypothetical protein